MEQQKEELTWDMVRQMSADNTRNIADLW